MLAVYRILNAMVLPPLCIKLLLRFATNLTHPNSNETIICYVLPLQRLSLTVKDWLHGEIYPKRGKPTGMGVELQKKQVSAQQYRRLRIVAQYVTECNSLEKCLIIYTIRGTATHRQPLRENAYPSKKVGLPRLKKKACCRRLFIHDVDCL